jgi:hypothetical protein
MRLADHGIFRNPHAATDFRGRKTLGPEGAQPFNRFLRPIHEGTPFDLPNTRYGREKGVEAQVL